MIILVLSAYYHINIIMFIYERNSLCHVLIENLLQFQKIYNMKTLLYIFIITPFFLFSQVGINTTIPQETLHVAGTLRVTNTTTEIPTKLTGMDSNGTMTDVVIGTNLQLSGNVLNASGSGFYFAATKSLPGGSSGEEYNNLDLDLLVTNIDRTLFRLTDRTAGYEITGIAGGTNGRDIVLFNVSTSNLKIYDEDIRSIATNRIITLKGGFVGTSGQGTAELVYDGALNRWILIAFRD